MGCDVAGSPGGRDGPGLAESVPDALRGVVRKSPSGASIDNPAPDPLLLFVGLGAGYTSPRAAASSLLTLSSAFDGLPRFLAGGCFSVELGDSE